MPHTETIKGKKVSKYAIRQEVLNEYAIYINYDYKIGDILYSVSCVSAEDKFEENKKIFEEFIENFLENVV